MRALTRTTFIAASFLAFMLGSHTLFAASIFQFEDFSSSANWTNSSTTAGTPTGWVNDDTDNSANAGVVYGRDGVISVNTELRVFINNGASGRLEFRGATGATITDEHNGANDEDGVVNNGNYSYLGIWLGRMAQFTGTVSGCTASGCNASANQPFGIQVIKTQSRLDSSDDNSNDESHRHMDGFSFYVYQDQAGVFGTTGATLSNSILMYEIYRAQRPVLGAPLSQWGYFLSSENNFNLASGLRPDGATLDISGNPVQWNYDDYFSTCTTNGSACLDDSGNKTDASNNTTPVNTNQIGIRIINDGTQYKFYINPDPDNNDAAPNEYIQVGSVNATFTTNLKFMMGVEAARADTEMEWVELDNLLIRSVADGDVASTKVELIPTTIKTSSTANTFKMVINPTINANDAGISEIKITKPPYITDTWDIATLNVYTTHGGGAAWSEIGALKAFTVNNLGGTCTVSGQPAAGTVNACTSGNDLILRFNATSAASNDVIKNADAEKRIGLEFQFDAPGSANAAGEAFSVYIGNEKYDSSHTDNTTGNNGLAYATTGWQNVLAGDAYAGSGWAGNTLTVKTLGVPNGYSSVTPAVIYVGTPQNFQNFVATPDDPNNSNVDKIEMEIYAETYDPGGTGCAPAQPSNPACFTEGAKESLANWGISGTNFVSSLLDSSPTSSISSDTIAFNYSTTGIPGQNGLDKLTVTATSTPTVLTKSYYRLKSRVFNVGIDSATGNLTTAGIFDADGQWFELRPAKPVAVAYIDPTSPCNGVADTICNNLASNNFTFILTNNGKDGNNIKTIRLSLSDEFTGISNVNVTVNQGSDSFSFTDTSQPTKVTFNNVAGSKYLEIGLDAIGSGAAANGLLGRSTGAKSSVTVTFDATDSIASLSGSTAVSFSGYVDNGNGDALTDNPFTGDSSGTLALSWENPYSRGKSETLRATDFNYSIGNPSGASDFYVTSSNDTVKVTYRIFNPSTVEDPNNVDNTIKMAEIVVPATFTSIANVVSAKESNSSNINVTGNTITITYTTPIATGDFDEVSFNVQETNNAKATVSFTSRVSNTTNTGDYKSTSDLNVNSNQMNFVYQPLNAVAWTEVCHNVPTGKPSGGNYCSTSETADNENDPTKVDSELRWDNGSKVNVIRYHLINTGLAGAKIYKLRIYLRDGDEANWDTTTTGLINTSWIADTESQAFTSVTGDINGSGTGITCTADPTYANKYIECDFTGHASGGVDVGDSAFIQFSMGHKTPMPSSQEIGLYARALNDLGVDNSNTYYPNASATSMILAASTSQDQDSTSTVEVTVAKPRAKASGYITPSVALVQSSSVNHTFVYNLKNDGVGNNFIYKMKIAIPTEWQGKVTIDNGGASLDRGAAVSIVGTDIEVNYEGLADCTGDAYSVGCLDTTTNTDRIQFTLAHDIATEGSSTWALSATNDSSPDTIVYDAGSVTSQKSNKLYLVKKVTKRITSAQDVNSSSPGNPTQLYTTNTLPVITYRLVNNNAASTGQAIKRARISVPSNFIITAITSTVLGTVTPPVSPAPIVLNYESTPLTGGNLDDIQITFKKDVGGNPFTVGTYNWPVEIYYNDGSSDALVDSTYAVNGTGGDWFPDSMSDVISGASIDTEFVRPPLPATAYLANNTTLFDSKENYIGLDFPGWGNLDGDNNPTGDTLNTSLDDNKFSFYVQNDSTISGNNLSVVKITAPSGIVSALEKTAAMIAVVKDPNGTPSTLTQANTTSPTAKCTGWDFATGDYCIDETTSADVLTIKFKDGVVPIGTQVRIDTAITKDAAVTSAANGAFTVEVTNDPGGSNLSAATTPLPEGPTNFSRSLTLYYYAPSVSFQFHVQKTNSSAGESGNDNMLYKTETSHAVSLAVRNNGHAGSELSTLNITIPSNTLDVTSARITSNAGESFYAGTQFTCTSGCGAFVNPAGTATDGDEYYPITASSITLSLASGFMGSSVSKTFLFTNLATAATAQSGGEPYPADYASAVANDKFALTADINSRYTNTYTGSVTPGKVEVIYLKTPAPSGEAWVLSSDAQLQTTGGVLHTSYAIPDTDHDATTTPTYKRKIRIYVNNTGSGNNNLRQIKISVPTYDPGSGTVSLFKTLVQGEMSQGGTATAGTLTLAGDDNAGYTVTVDYGASDFVPGEQAIITIPVDFNLLDIPSPAPTWTVQVANIPTPTSGDYVTVGKPTGETLTQSFVFPPSNVYSNISAGATLFSLNKSDNSQTFTHTIEYKVAPKGRDLDVVSIHIPHDLKNASGVTLSGNVNLDTTKGSGSDGIDSACSAGETVDTANRIVTIDYTTGGCTAIAAGSSDTIKIYLTGTLNGGVASGDAATYVMDTRYDNGNLGSCSGAAAVKASLQADDSTCLKSVFSSDAGETQTFTVMKAPVVSLSGTILPLKNVKNENLQVNVSVEDTSGNILTDYAGSPLTALTSAGSGTFSFAATTADTGNALPVCGPLSGGTYTNCSDSVVSRNFVLVFSAGGYQELRVPVTLERNLITDLGNLGPLVEEPFKVNGNDDNIAVGRESDGTTSCAELHIPKEGINETFSVRITCSTLAQIPAKASTLEQEMGLDLNLLKSAFVSGETGIKAGSAPDSLSAFLFNILDSSNKELLTMDLLHRETGKGIQNVAIDAYIKLKYDETAVLANGWKESDLAVFSYDVYRKKWYKVGGVVDENANTVTSGINTLGRYYAVFAADSSGGFIRDVSVSPRLFTPGHGTGVSARHFNRMALSFSFQKPVDSYEVGIFSVGGKQIIKFEKPGQYANGQIFWDGYDSNGNRVSGGIYIYVIRAGGEKYRGTVVVVR